MGITLAPMSTCSYTDLLSGRVTSFREANLRSEKYKDGPNGLKNAVCVRTNDGKVPKLVKAASQHPHA